jgi:hypothetical protein
MANEESARLAKVVRDKIEEFKRLCEGIDEKTASQAPSGRWSPKEIVSHLCGPEGVGFLASIQVFLDKDTPRVDIKAEDPFFTEKRSRMSLKELLVEADKEYARIAGFVEKLSDAQLARKAHIPLLKDTPIGEYPTLATWIGAIGGYHIGFHMDHMREILQALGVSAAPGVKK